MNMLRPGHQSEYFLREDRHRHAHVAVRLLQRFQQSAWAGGQAVRLFI